jgi:hypothetical protein
MVAVRIAAVGEWTDGVGRRHGRMMAGPGLSEDDLTQPSRTRDTTRAAPESCSGEGGEIG